MRGYFQIASLAKAVFVGPARWLWAQSWPASSAWSYRRRYVALVGPAREAPEFAPYVVVVLDQTGGKADALQRERGCAQCRADRGPLHQWPCGHARIFPREFGRPCVLFEVETIAIHPGYKPDALPRGAYSIDLALLLLSEPLPSQFTPVQLSDTGLVAVGQRVRIAGFGLSDEDKVRIASFGPSNEDISGTSGVLRAGVLMSSRPKSKFSVLVDPEGAGLGGCIGDSGAPIFAIDRPAARRRGDKSERATTANHVAFLPRPCSLRRKCHGFARPCKPGERPGAWHINAIRPDCPTPGEIIPASLWQTSRVEPPEALSAVDLMSDGAGSFLLGGKWSERLCLLFPNDRHRRANQGMA